MKLLRETNDKESNLPKHKAKITTPEKQSVVSQKQSVVSQKQSVVSQKQSVVSQKQSVVYTSLQISKLNLKRLRIERMHT